MEVSTIVGFFVTYSEVIGFCYISIILTITGMVGNILMYLTFNYSRKRKKGDANKNAPAHSASKEKVRVIDDFKENTYIEGDSTKEAKDDRKNGERNGEKTYEGANKGAKSKSSGSYYSGKITVLIIKIYTLAMNIVKINRVPGEATLTIFYAEMLSAINFAFCLTLIPWPLLYFWGALHQSLFWRSKPYNVFMSNLEFPLRNIFSKISTGIVLCMTVDRFIALKIPLRYKSVSTLKNGKIALIVISLATVFMESTTVFWYTLTYIDFIVMKNYLYYNASANNSIEHWLSRNATSFSEVHTTFLSNISFISRAHSRDQYINIYSGYFRAGGTKFSRMRIFFIIENVREVIMVGLPMILIAVLSYFIVVAHRSFFRNKKRMKEKSRSLKDVANINNDSSIQNDDKSTITKGNRNNAQLKLSAEESRATLTQLTIVIQFFLCEVPQALITAVYNRFSCRSLNDIDCKFRDFIVVTNVLQLANHCVTFYVFLVFNDNFRKLLRDLFTQ
ncbi:unnamed protein product [Gordionus sp. m RMFG-2023]